MSVVQIKERVTKSAVDFQSYSSSSSSFIYTTAADENIENFSIELSLGDGWNENYSSDSMGLMKIDESISIGGRASIVVEVAEEVRVPFNKYGIVLPTGSLFLSQGVLIASAKVEPAFHGKLKLRLFNTTNKRLTLKKGRKLGSIIFFSTEATIAGDIINRNSSISDVRKSRFYPIIKWFGDNKIVWIGWLVAIVSPWVLALLMYIFYYGPMLDGMREKLNLSENQVRVETSEKRVGK